MDDKTPQLWTQLWTLISVVVGGLVTYFTTSAVETRKLKQSSMIEKLNKIYIPFCKSVEEAIDYNQLALNNQFLFKKYLDGMGSLLSFSSAEKRVFLPKKIRRLLEDYEKDYNKSCISIARDQDELVNLYQVHVINLLMNYPNIEKSAVTVSMKSHAQEIAGQSIAHGSLRIKPNDIDCVTFISTDGNKTFEFSDELIDWSLDLSDPVLTFLFEKDPSLKDTYEIGCYIYNNNKSNAQINDFIKNHISVEFCNLINLLAQMRREIIWHIDRIT